MTTAEAYEKICNKIKEVKLLRADIKMINERLKKAGVERFNHEALYDIERSLNRRIMDLEYGIEKLAKMAYKSDQENGTEKPSFD